MTNSNDLIPEYPMPQTSDENALQAAIARRVPGMSLEQAFYRSPYIYERDLKLIWNKNWLWAGHASQVPHPGDYFVFEFGYESVIIVRDNDRQLRAHINVCRHRGSRVCVEAAGNTGAFSCPYHGWTYQLDGELRRGRAMPDGFDPSTHGLHAAHLIEFHGLLFINLGDQPPDFTPALDQLAIGLTPFNIADTKVVETRRYPVPANWKLALENYLECYHCAPAHKAYAKSHSLQNPEEKHPELIARLRDKASAAGLTNHTISAAGLDAKPIGTDIYLSRYPLYPGYVTGSESGEPLAPLLGDLKEYDGGATDIQIGPLSYFLAYSDHVVGYRFLPRDIQSTDIEVMWLVREDAQEGEDYELDKLIWLWDVTSQDDERIIRYNQAGVNSAHYRPGLLSTMETSITSFHNWYLHLLKG